MRDRVECLSNVRLGSTETSTEFHALSHGQFNNRQMFQCLSSWPEPKLAVVDPLKGLRRQCPEA
eukprot:14419008-Alexandrium_andersonii.AAC.1